MLRPVGRSSARRNLVGAAVTSRQWDVLSFVLRFGRENGFPPSLREIGRELDIKSTNGVSDHIVALQRRGLISHRRGQVRTLVVTPAGRELLEGAVAVVSR